MAAACMIALPDPAGPQAQALARALGVTITLADVLHRRGRGDDDETRRFLDPRLGQLTPPHEMAGRAAAVDRIARAIRARERIAIFGDYDCDGITSVAILTEVITALGGDIEPLLADRFGGGYGLTDEAASRVLEARPSLLITCDCGSSDHPRLERLRAAGVDVVVIDHHLVPDEPIPVVAFLNPHRPDCPFPYKNLSSCGLALSLAAGLRAVLDSRLDVRRWLDLVAIGTVADVVPLDGDNRVLVRAGMRMIQSSPRPGLRWLASLANVALDAGVTSDTIAFDIAPRLNAPGRLGSARPALDLVMASDATRAREGAAQLEELRTQRVRSRRASRPRPSRRSSARGSATIRRSWWGGRDGTPGWWGSSRRSWWSGSGGRRWWSRSRGRRDAALRAVRRGRVCTICSRGARTRR